MEMILHGEGAAFDRQNHPFAVSAGDGNSPGALSKLVAYKEGSVLLSRIIIEGV